MNYPLLYFVDSDGKKLPEKDGYQYCQQFNDWYIEVEGDWSGGVGLLRESEASPLHQNSVKQWQVITFNLGSKKEEERKKKVKKKFDDHAGWLTAVLLDSDSQPIARADRARLWVSPGSLSESDLNEIVAEIGLLALSTESVFSYPSRLYQGEQAGEELGCNIVLSPDSQLLTTPRALLNLYHIVHSLWTEIEKRPLRSFKREIISVDITKNLSSPQVLISRKLRPSKKQMLTVGSVESLDCSENQFLCYVIDVYLKDIVSGWIEIIKDFNLRPSASDDSLNLIPQNNKSNYSIDIKISSFWEESRRKSAELSSKFNYGKKKREEMLQQLKNCVQWAKEVRCNSFLKDIVTPDNPYLSSQRLIKSPTYGSILEAYNNCNGSHSHRTSQIIRLYLETHNFKVRRTWQIYEIWCVIKVYSELVTQLRLAPPINAKSLFESITLSQEGEEKEISIPTNQEFKLEGRLVDGTSIEISFWYEPKEYPDKTKQGPNDHLTPDIKLKIVVNNQESIYFLDAKYKNYQAEQERKEFFRNVILTAKYKYFKKLNAKACFILHSDLEFDFWGEVPYKTFIKDKFIEESESTDETDYIGHRYGAIALTPGVHADTQINKLIRLIFQYHGDLCTTCLKCGCEARTQTSWIPDPNHPAGWTEQMVKEKIINRVRGNWSSAIYCSCPQCGEFWVVQRCKGNDHHRLLKCKDSDSFHQRSKLYTNSWMSVCPECGSDPDFSKQ